MASASRELVPTPSIVDSASTGYIIAPALASRVDSSLTQTMSADVACESSPPSPVEQPVEYYFEGAHIETVSDFCYLGDVTGNTGGCADAVTARIKSSWKSFRELLPLLTNRAISPHHRGDVFSACVRAVLLHVSET